MPRKKRPVQFGKYYLSKRSNSPMWCRSWFDPVTRQTKRESLGTEDLAEAAETLKSWFIKYAEQPLRSSEQITLAEVAMRYYAQHGRYLPGAGAGVQARNLEIVIEHVGELTVAEFTRDAQERFNRRLKEKYAPATIRRIFSAIFAALNRAYQCEEIDRIPPRIRLPDSPPKEYVATIDELATFWDADKSPQMQMFFVLLLATGARPSSILQLSRFQCDLRNGFIDLNPPGRAQTAKRRPIVPMCDVARAWIEAAKGGPLVHYYGRPIKYPNKAWRELRRSVGLPEEFTPGAMRHTLASELRRKGVPPAQIAGLLGHSMPNWRTTERYAKYDPRFMVETTEAINRFFDDIAQRTETGLDPQRVSGVPMARREVPNPLKMVDAAGIEPATPTMST